MGKELTERKKRILHALVDLYISTGQPVSSSDIQSKYLPEVSSATVRAELSALEALGYIEQPHTSAGRIPLKDAYKFYVESISSFEGNMLTDQETALIRDRFMNKLGKIQDMSIEAAKIISDATNYTSFIVEKNAQDVVIDGDKIYALDDKRIVVINNIGGSDWSRPTETLYWEFKVKNTGWYSIGFNYKQSELVNGVSKRSLKIDGKTPFDEAENISFEYSTLSFSNHMH